MTGSCWSSSSAWMPPGSPSNSTGSPSPADRERRRRRSCSVERRHRRRQSAHRAYRRRSHRVRASLRQSAATLSTASVSSVPDMASRCMCQARTAGRAALATNASSCTARVIATYSRRRPSVVPSRMFCGSTTTTPSNSRPFTARAEQRHVVVTEFVDVIDRRQPDAGQSGDDARGAGRRHHTGQSVAVLDFGHDLGGDLGDIGRRRRVPGGRLALGAHAAAGDRRHAREREQTVGDVEDGLGHPVADRQVGDVRAWRRGGRTRRPSAPDRPAWWTGRRHRPS